MKYTVLWTPAAEEHLAAIWIDAPNRNAVTEAVNSMDSSLRNNPASQGESRHGSLRITFWPPLGVNFEVVQEDRTVYVVAVWSFGKE